MGFFVCRIVLFVNLRLLFLLCLFGLVCQYCGFGGGCKRCVLLVVLSGGYLYF